MSTAIGALLIGIGILNSICIFVPYVRRHLQLQRQVFLAGTAFSFFLLGGAFVVANTGARSIGKILVLIGVSVMLGGGIASAVVGRLDSLKRGHGGDIIDRQ